MNNFFTKISIKVDTSEWNSVRNQWNLLNENFLEFFKEIERKRDKIKVLSVLLYFFVSFRRTGDFLYLYYFKVNFYI